ncbi:MAG: 16S rRNA (guanine(527)-N(7))-methyltransferase RsmG [Mycobacteriales bacterium]
MVDDSKHQPIADRPERSNSIAGVKPVAPDAALVAASEQLFGAQVNIASQYAGFLATVGVDRGLLGPREASRIWDRHLLNCAPVAELIPQNSDVLDVGSGAGLPGIALAIARPDLRVTLLEPLLRREQFLTQVVKELGLSQVSVVRGRVEAVAKSLPTMNIVTARAVAPLERLLDWCIPLLGRGGRLLAMKGGSAEEEVAEASAKLAKLRVHGVRVVRCGNGTVSPSVVVVEVTK